MKHSKIISLKGRNNFLEVFKRGKAYNSSTASALLIFRADPIKKGGIINNPEKLKVQIAVVIKKRNCKKAVIRNRIRRLVRESLRKSLSEEEFSKIPIYVDKMVIIWKKAPEHAKLIKLKDAERTVSLLLEKIDNSIKLISKIIGHENFGDIVN
jgi:ribonuclease P protein component